VENVALMSVLDYLERKIIDALKTWRRTQWRLS
jgi:hypothetical protein